MTQTNYKVAITRASFSDIKGSLIELLNSIKWERYISGAKTVIIKVNMGHPEYEPG